ncbi:MULTISPECIES: LCP family protein [Treponema]|uniref:LCP family protein n=1 Tax=Treponema peruense TaxID=2787628 RepID=A0A7T3V5T0_9SPIR|nr:LCP family protein [Treponema peruense]QQA01872.1 LCP family protein [Treponema peruense]
MVENREKKGVVFLVVILAIIIGVGVFIAATLRVDPVAETLKKEPVIKILFVLSDDSGNALSTDVFVYYPVSRKGALFDILGNTGSIYSSLGRVDRIDAVYKEKGVDTYRKEVEKLIGKTIPFSLEISLSDLGTLADLLGGLKVFIPTPVDAKGENGERWLLPSGAVTLDGDKVATYMTYRSEDDSDGDAGDRRQGTLISLLASIRDNKNVILEKKNFRRFGEKFRFNMDESSLYKLFQEIVNVDAERLAPQTITGSLRVVDGKTLLFPYYDGQLIKDIVNQTIGSLVNDENSSQNRIYVLEIQNGTGRQGLARNTSFLMQSAGYEVLETLNADSDNYAHTVIVNHIGNREAALALGNFIRCRYIVDDEVKPGTESFDSVARADFTIILGDDFDGRFVKGGYKGPEVEAASDTDGEE